MIWLSIETQSENGKTNTHTEGERKRKWIATKADANNDTNDRSEQNKTKGEKKTILEKYPQGFGKVFLLFYEVTCFSCSVYTQHKQSQSLPSRQAFKWIWWCTLNTTHAQHRTAQHTHNTPNIVSPRNGIKNQRTHTQPTEKKEWERRKR